MPRGVRAAFGYATLATAMLAGQAPAPPDPFAFLSPVVALSRGERASLDRGETLVRTLPGSGSEVAILAVTPMATTGERLAAWIGQIADLKAGPQVTAIARFSSPPRLADLDRLTLDDEDLESIRRCRVGDCDVKLSRAEIEGLGRIAREAGSNWKADLQSAYRSAMLARVESYVTGGYSDQAMYHDRRPPVVQAVEFGQILDRSPFLAARMPRLADHLRGFPAVPDPTSESFLYWSKEALGGKSVVLLTHVNVIGGGGELPEVLIAAKQVYASHYMTGSLALTMLMPAVEGARPYFIYLNRSRVDAIGGLFGGIVRAIVERRLRGEATDLVDALRRRIEGGPPPPRLPSLGATPLPIHAR